MEENLGGKYETHKYFLKKWTFVKKVKLGGCERKRGGTKILQMVKLRRRGVTRASGRDQQQKKQEVKKQTLTCHADRPVQAGEMGQGSEISHD